MNFGEVITLSGSPFGGAPFEMRVTRWDDNNVSVAVDGEGMRCEFTVKANRSQLAALAELFTKHEIDRGDDE